MAEDWAAIVAVDNASGDDSRAELISWPMRQARRKPLSRCR
ncbi:MAG TPA: hypothetical protein VFI42_02570 [Thermomicrobiaceae bacterium]|nr:hypothetical protein [Thermomicrobiaceae bacterium]